MAAPIGNKFYLLQSSYGRKPIFKEPEDLWKAACEYFEAITENPLVEEQVYCNKDGIQLHDAPKLRAMTITGLCVFLNITVQTWTNYKKKEAFVEICSRVSEIIYSQKFEGAAAGLLNHAIITRELGLADKKDLDVNGTISLNVVGDEEDL